MNTDTPRIFIAATRQNDGKTTTSLGLMAALQKFYPRVGYIKPVGQRFVEIEEQKIDEDTVLMDRVYRLNCPLADMSPIAVEPDFTRKYLDGGKAEVLEKRIQKAFDRVAWEKDFVLCEGSGHAGVGSVFDLSNARVASLLGAKVVIVSRGGIGLPIDEVAINHALLEKEGVDVIGIILNKVLPDKIGNVAEFARRGFRRKGLDLLGVLPHQPILTRPTVDAIHDELRAELVAGQDRIQNRVEEVVVGAMSVHHAMKHFRAGVLLITPGDREDIILAAAATESSPGGSPLAGLVLTDDTRPAESVLHVIRNLPHPVLLAKQDSYEVASRVHDMIVKTRPADTEKIELIRDLIAKHVNVKRILDRL